MKNLKKIFINLLIIIALFSCLGNVIFAYPTQHPLAWDNYRQGSTQEKDCNRLRRGIGEIKNSSDPDVQKQRIQEIFVEYVYRGRQMPSVEPEFILELCSIISRIPNPEIKLLIFTRILFPLLHMQLIYDKYRANRWTDRETERGDNYTFNKRIWCDLYRVLKSKKGVCRNFANVIKVIFDLIEIPNVLVYTDDHIFNAYLNLQWRVCDLTWEINGEITVLLPQDEWYPLPYLLFPPFGYWQLTGGYLGGYLDYAFKPEESITIISVAPKDYSKPYNTVVSNNPRACLQVNFNSAYNRRKTVVIVNGRPTSKKVFSEDIRSLFS